MYEYYLTPEEKEEAYNRECYARNDRHAAFLLDLFKWGNIIDWFPEMKPSREEWERFLAAPTGDHFSRYQLEKVEKELFGE